MRDLSAAQCVLSYWSAAQCVWEFHTEMIKSPWCQDIVNVAATFRGVSYESDKIALVSGNFY